MMEKIEQLQAMTGLGFGMAVSLLKSAGFMTDGFLGLLSFDQLEEICRERIDHNLRELILKEMTDRSPDFWQWKTIYALSPRGEFSFDRENERRQKAVSEMERLAGNDFAKLYALCKLLRAGRCEVMADFRNIADAAEDKICRGDCSLTLQNALLMLNGESRNSKFYSKAYRWMMVYVNDELKDTAK